MHARPICLKCGGSGNRLYPAYRPHAPSQPTWVRCQTCKGSGYVPAREPEPLELEEIESLYAEIGGEGG